MMKVGPDREPGMIEIRLRPERWDVVYAQKIDQRILLEISRTVPVPQIDRRKDRRAALSDIVEGRSAGGIDDRRAGGDFFSLPRRPRLHFAARDGESVLGIGLGFAGFAAGLAVMPRQIHPLVKRAELPVDRLGEFLFALSIRRGKEVLAEIRRAEVRDERGFRHAENADPVNVETVDRVIGQREIPRKPHGGGRDLRSVENVG